MQGMLTKLPIMGKWHQQAGREPRSARKELRTPPSLYHVQPSGLCILGQDQRPGDQGTPGMQ
jgi:hypothetical protein